MGEQAIEVRAELRDHWLALPGDQRLVETGELPNNPARPRVSGDGQGLKTCLLYTSLMARG
ncbi:hypothetical protein, partial [Streptomyces sp. NRRL S-15]|uniref:hypothetical protein n=1 Tax=Streptomyces sp. NRRL S-15 TaxID=1463886 RepID=UPI001F1C45BB